MKRITSLVTGILLLTPLFALGADWQFSANSDKRYYYVDFQSIAQVGQFTKAWVRSDYTEKQETSSYPKKYFQSSKLLYYFDCKAKLLAVVQNISYEKIMADGDVVDTYTHKFDPKLLDDVVPESIGEGLMRVVCSGPGVRAKVRAANKASDEAMQRRIDEMVRQRQQGAKDQSAAPQEASQP